MIKHPFWSCKSERMPDTVMTFTKLPISIHLAKGIDFFLKIAVFLQAICFGIPYERQKKNSRPENPFELAH